VEWLCQNRTEGCTIAAMNNAAMYGHLEIVKLLHENGKTCTDYAMIAAISHSEFEVVKWLHLNRSESTLWDTVVKADRCQQFEMIEWFNTNFPERMLLK
jgi:hypothetical protein